MPMSGCTGEVTLRSRGEADSIVHIVGNESILMHGYMRALTLKGWGKGDWIVHLVGHHSMHAKQ
jgi:hypothetical protein